MASHFWKAPPDPQEVHRLRHEVAAYAADHGIERPALDDLTLAVSEVIANAVMHAYPDERRGTITVMATAHQDEVVVRVLDDGVGLRARTDSPGAGLGLSIAGAVAKRIVVERAQQGGTDVRMTFARTA